MKQVLFLMLIVGQAAFADAPEVVKVDVSKPGMGHTFHVTIAHPDAGWDHYADGWEIIDASGARLGFRELMHPHVHEQPFTRSLRDVMLPDGTREVWVRVRCSRDGWSETLMRVEVGR